MLFSSYTIHTTVFRDVMLCGLIGRCHHLIRIAGARIEASYGQGDNECVTVDKGRKSGRSQSGSIGMSQRNCKKLPFMRSSQVTGVVIT